MLLEIEARPATPVMPAALAPLPPQGRPRGTGAMALVALLWAFAPFLATAIDAAARGRVFLGVAGYYPMDGLQYLAWVADAHHGLIRNLFGPAGGAVFVHPLWTPSGLLQALTGVPDAWVMAFWKGASVVVLVAGAGRLVARVATGRRVAALALALFGGLTPVTILLYALDRGQAGEDLARAAGAASGVGSSATMASRIRRFTSTKTERWAE